VKNKVISKCRDIPAAAVAPAASEEAAPDESHKRILETHISEHSKTIPQQENRDGSAHWET
jgi:hypothetical protein